MQNTGTLTRFSNREEFELWYGTPYEFEWQPTQLLESDQTNLHAAKMKFLLVALYYTKN